MKIVEVSLARLRAPLITPFRTALRQVDAVEDIVVSLRTDTGHCGHGSAAPTAVITGDTHGSIVAAIGQCIGPLLVGRDVADLNGNVRRVQSALEHNTGAKAAVEIALHDLWAQRHAAPLYQMLGGGEPRLRTDVTISLNPVPTMIADALTALERGFDALKIKLGREPRLDIERVTAIHAAVAGRARLRLDANQGWSARQAVQVMQAIEEAGIAIDLLEQPVQAHDLEGLRHVTRHIRTAVMADEAVFGPRDALTLIQLRAADIVNIKLAKCGGLSNALRVADIAALHGVECMIGCMLESSIGIVAAAHLAVARADVVTRVDLDVPALCRFDPVESGTAFDGPDIRIGDAPGLGIVAIHGLEPIGS